MTPEQFIAKWKLSTLGERQAAQPHFPDLCELLGEPNLEDADNYCFERGASKALGRRGWTDVWNRISPGSTGASTNFDDASDEFKDRIVALSHEPPPIVCDLERFRMVTGRTALPRRYGPTNVRNMFWWNDG